jgi:hypothetical protein
MAHKHGDPIPTPNQPDQTPAEQRPEIVLDEQCCHCTCGTKVGKHAAHCDTVRCRS